MVIPNLNLGLPFDRLGGIGTPEINARAFTRPPGHTHNPRPGVCAAARETLLRPMR